MLHNLVLLKRRNGGSVCRRGCLKLCEAKEMEMDPLGCALNGFVQRCGATLKPSGNLMNRSAHISWLFQECIKPQSHQKQTV